MSQPAALWEQSRVTFANLLDLLDHPPADPPAATYAALRPLHDCRRLLARPTRQITLLGTFKAGKSTLLNALLGTELLPTRVLRATGVVTHVSPAPEPALRLVYAQPEGPSASVPVPFAERAHHILLDLSDPETAAPTIEAAHIDFPCPFLPPDWSIVDTPGLLDDPTLTVRSQRELVSTDLLVMVLSAYQLLSQGERDIIRSARRLLHGNIVFVINQIDTVTPAERAEVVARARLLLRGVGNPLVGQPRIFVTAASTTLEARLSGAPADPESALAGVLALEQWLASLLHGDTGQHIARLSRLGIVRSRLEQAEQTLAPLYAAAQQTAQRMTDEDQTTREQHMTSVQQAVADDRARLHRLEERLDALAARFVARCADEMQQRFPDVSPDRTTWTEAWTETWVDIWQASFAAAQQGYAQWLHQGVVAALAQTRLEVPRLTLSARFAQRTREAAALQWSVPGFLEGLTADVAAPFGFLLGGPVGEFVNDLAREMREEGQRQAVSTIEHAARELLPLLRAETYDYLARVHAALTDWGAVHMALHRPAPQLAAARHTEQRYQRLAEWLHALQREGERLHAVWLPDETG